MSLNSLYSELYALLNESGAASVVSHYKSDASIERKLVPVLLDAPADEQLQGAQTTDTGAMTKTLHADGSLGLIERYTAKPRLIILGGGHISLALAEMAPHINFDTIIYDDRPSFANTQRFAKAKTVICDSFSRLSQHLSLGEGDYVVSLTRGHLHDKQCLEVILQGQEPAYTGMIGSRRRATLVFEQLRNEGFNEERIARIHSPVGLSIGAQTPSEIAVSIMAQIIKVKRNKTQPQFCAELDLVEQVALKGFAPEAVITVLATEGSVPTEVGCKLGMTYEGSTAGTIGGGCSEAEAMRVGREVIKNSTWQLLDIDLTDSAEDEGMVCGGTMQVLIEKV